MVAGGRAVRVANPSPFCAGNSLTGGKRPLSFWSQTAFCVRGRPWASRVQVQLQLLDAECEQHRISVRRTSHLLNEPHCPPAKVTKSAHEDSTRRDLAAGMPRVRSIRRELRVGRHPIVAGSLSVKRVSTVVDSSGVSAKHEPSCRLLRSSAAQRRAARTSCGRMRLTRARSVKICTTSRFLCTKMRR